MKRKIKFRAWNKAKNIMLGVASLQKLATCNHYLEIEEHRFMQYTGLKDKNAKEIYEGDIVDITTGSTINRYTADMFGLRNTINDYGGIVEVIGNLYENKELLDNIDKNDRNRNNKK